MILAIALAVLGAAGNASASVLQRKAARDEPDANSFSIALVWHLAHRPVWIAGIASVIAGFLLQVVALGNGPISLVQPVLVLELPFTLLLSSRVLGAQVHHREWWAVAALTAGLALLLLALAPRGGNPTTVSALSWLIGLAVSLAAVLTLTVLGRRHPGATGAAALGVATGIGFGLTAVLVKAMTATYTHGIGAVLTSWQTYLIIVIGPASFFLLQNALQAGSLVASQPGLTLSNPAIAVAWGITVLGEQVRTGGWVVLALFGGALIAAGTVLLARSPLFHQGDDDNGGTPNPNTEKGEGTPNTAPN